MLVLHITNRWLIRSFRTLKSHIKKERILEYFIVNLAVTIYMLYI